MPDGQPKIHIEAHQDHLVVDLSQLDWTLKALDRIQVAWTSVTKSHLLGLALISLEKVSVPGEYTGPADQPGLDRLISYLRQEFGEKDRKRLIIGKNRIVGSVVGSPYTGGGEGVPQPSAGAAQGGIQPVPLGGALPKRTEPPALGVGTGILDTRLFAHPDLDGRYLASHGTLAPDVPASPPDQDAHATFIAGVVLERAPNANLLADHVLNESDVATSSWLVATKMAKFAEAGVTVLNLSFGAATEDDKPPLVLKRAVEVLNKHAVVVVAAAGNHGPDTKPIWPAALQDDEASVVAVGAGHPDDTGQFVSAAFSPDASWVDLIAPGENIYSTFKASGYATWSGTSFAAAAVTGAVTFLVQTQNMTAAEAVHWLRTPPAERKEPAVSALIDDIGPRA